ncbi:PREDICTED: methylmalonyl-CoA epimerase, mitochondrial-like [Priapulus caudatus]|uniref:Methylmalonyl-CoA epimerase, mitochondrial-like n=1 Tax=Priapulus caudatus TaxID=37621 RepID=A0ABM1E1G8_PRICU|nr:PREDICTED: methylmalonyl-CoA epimerase, mitochondrial-like [Priapulus caudatus]
MNVAGRGFVIASRKLVKVSGCFTHLRNVSTQNMPKKLWKLGKLNHVAIACPNLEAAMDFYRDVLGATVGERMPQKEHGVYTVFVTLGETKIELLHPLGENSPISAFLEKNKMGGMHHICLEVSDINAAIADAKAHNIRTLGKEPKIGAHNKPVMFLHPKDCNGVLVELEEV